MDGKIVMKNHVKYYLYIFSCSLGRYVGITTRIKNRRSQHNSKYDNIKFHIIKKLYDYKEAIEAEKDVIRRIGLNNLLNKNKSGFCPLGRKCTNEVREKMSKARLGKKFSSKTKEKLSLSKLGNKNPNFGKRLSDEEKENLREIMSGRKVNYETKKKMSLAMLGNKNPLGHKHTKESKKKMSISNKKAWIKRRRKMDIKKILKEIKTEKR